MREVKDKVTVTGNLKNIERVREELHLEAANLIKNASSFEWKIKEYLTHLRDEIKADEKEKAEATIMEISQVIDDCEKWLAALSEDLEKAKKVHVDFVTGVGHKEQGDKLFREGRRFGYGTDTANSNYLAAGEQYTLAGRYELALESFGNNTVIGDIVRHGGLRNIKKIEDAHVKSLFECYRHSKNARMALIIKLVLDNPYSFVHGPPGSGQDDVPQWGNEYLTLLRNMGVEGDRAISLLISALEDLTYVGLLKLSTEEINRIKGILYFTTRNYQSAMRTFESGDFFEEALVAARKAKDKLAIRRLEEKVVPSRKKRYVFA